MRQQILCQTLNLKRGGGGGCSFISEPAQYPYLNLKQNIEVNPASALLAAAVVARAIMMVRKAS